MISAGHDCELAPVGRWGALTGTQTRNFARAAAWLHRPVKYFLYKRRKTHAYSVLLGRDRVRATSEFHGAEPHSVGRPLQQPPSRRKRSRIAPASLAGAESVGQTSVADVVRSFNSVPPDRAACSRPAATERARR